MVIGNDFGIVKKIVCIGKNMNETLYDHYWISAYQQIKTWKQNNGKKDLKMISGRGCILFKNEYS